MKTTIQIMTNELLQVAFAAVTAFGATNLDDILILMFLFSQVNSKLRFSQVNSKLRVRHIILGQYLGISLVLLLSLPGFLGGLVLPKSWTGLLGFLPIAIGVHKLCKTSDDDLSFLTIAPPVFQRRKKRGFHFLSPPICSVATITFANGGDNISVYVPLFASLNPIKLALVLAIFYFLVGVWCAMAYGLASHPLIGKLMNRSGKHLIPFILILLGLWILWDSHSYELLTYF
ncbi:MAG: cadmium resistance transporter [Cyanobacteriota bacterium]|nr:cadmium resistance transporter [Cyanobacteriota bacterium]